MGRSTLGDWEETVLLALAKLGETYGVPLRHEISAARGEDVSVGALYTALERLTKKGFVETWEGEPTAVRGGRRKRFFRITGAGELALHEKDRSRAALRPDWLGGAA